MPPIAEKTINFTVFRNGTERLGVATVDLPSIEALTATVSGAGIAGEIDSPTLGHFGSISMTLNWRTIEVQSLSLAAPGTHALDLRSVQQVYDPITGTQRSAPVRISVRAQSKSIGLGTLGMNATTDSTNEMEVTYLKVMVDGVTQLEIDKFNYIFRVGGTDYLAEMRSQLGI